MNRLEQPREGCGRDRFHGGIMATATRSPGPRAILSRSPASSGWRGACGVGVWLGPWPAALLLDRGANLGDRFAVGEELP